MFWGGLSWFFGDIVSDEKDVLKGKNASDLDQEMKNFSRRKK
jgi:hypothetical protein